MTRLADTVIAHYEKHALAWEADRRNSFWNDKLWHGRFVENLPGSEVLDLGCGAGIPVAAHLHAHGLRITGVDSSPTMISLCRLRLPDHEAGFAKAETQMAGTSRAKTHFALLARPSHKLKLS